MNKFQRILLASGLAASASLMGNSAAFADTTAIVPLSGTIPSSLTITVTPTGNNNIPLVPGTTYSLALGNATKIATISAASTNSAGGLKVTVTGSDSLMSSSLNSIAISGIQEALTTTATSATNGGGFGGSRELLITKSSSSGAAPDSSIFITYIVPPGQAPGTYTGNLLFTATDN